MTAARKTEDHYLPVKVIKYSKGSVLVEYLDADNHPVRKCIPPDRLSGKTARESDLAKGIPYGYPWEEIGLQFDPARFGEELRNRGVWTAHDAMKSPQSVHAALNATIADNLKSVLEQARAEVKGDTQ